MASVYVSFKDSGAGSICGLGVELDEKGELGAWGFMRRINSGLLKISKFKGENSH